jgi:iron complex outermembrane receptor protein
MEMKKLFLGICYLFMSQLALAQTLKGKITDSSAAPVASATVALNNSSVITDEAGNFQFRNLRPGNHVLRVSSIGFRNFEKIISADTGFIEIRLQPLNLFMQAVEVRAIRAGDNAPFTKTNILKKDIEKLNLGQDLPFILNQTPSVLVNSDAGNGVGYTGIRIRGSDATRINMTINGIPYNDAESQGLFFVNLPDFASSVSNIQIQRGVGTSSNGAGAFGASMNFSTNEVNTNPYGEINNGFGSFDTWKHTVKAGSGLIGDHFTIDARLSNIRSDGYVDRAKSDLHSLYLSGAYLSPGTSIRFNLISGKEKTYQAWNGVPEALLNTNRTYNSSGTEKPGEPYDNETDNYQQDHFQLFLNHQFNKGWTFNTAFFLTKGKGYYENYKADQSFADYGLPDFNTGSGTISTTDLVRQLWLDNNYYGQILSVQHKSARGLLTIGGGWNKYDGHHFGEIIWAETGVPVNYRWYDLYSTKSDINGYAKYQYRVAKGLELFADMQYRRVNYELGGFRDNPTLRFDNKYDFFNPKAGLSYSFRDYQLYFSYSTGNKEPNRDDFEAGQSQRPKPERLHDFELGFEKRNSRFGWATTLYYMLYKDQLVQTGKINDVGSYTRTNIPDSYRMGLELQGHALITGWLNVSANLTLSKNRIKDFREFYDDYDNGGQKEIYHGSTDISFSPDIIGSGTVNIIPVKDLEIGLFSKYIGRQYLDNTSNKNRSLSDYFVQDARLSYSLRNLVVKQIDLMFQLNNVFNRKYEANGYTFSYVYGGQLVTENYYFPMAGINFMAGINIKL